MVDYISTYINVYMIILIKCVAKLCKFCFIFCCFL